MGGMQLKIEWAAHDLVTQVTCSTGFFQGLFKPVIGLKNFTMDVVVAHRDTHGKSSNGHAFNDDMWIELQDVPVFASARLTFVRVTHKVFLPRKLARHETPLQTSRKTCTATPTQTGVFHGGNDLVLGHTLCTLHTKNGAQSLVATTRFVVFQSPVFAIQASINLGLQMPAVKTGFRT